MATKGQVQEITEQDIKRGCLYSGECAIVECHKTFSGSIRIVEPIFELLAKRYRNRLIHFRINLDENPEFANDFMIADDPTYLLFNKGVLVEIINEIIPAREFEALINHYM